MPKKKTAQTHTKQWIEHAWEWLEPRLKPVLVVAIVVVVIVAVVWITVKRQESRNLKAQLAYFEIMKVEDEAARVLGLEEFAKKHKGEDVSYQALMTLGRYNFKKGNFDKAESFFEDVVNNTKGEMMYYFAVDALAPVYVQLGKSKEAADLYVEEAAYGSNPNPALSKLKAAQFYELAGDKNSAEKIYKELIDAENTPAKIKLKAEENLLWIAVAK